MNANPALFRTSVNRRDVGVLDGWSTSQEFAKRSFLQLKNTQKVPDTMPRIVRRRDARDYKLYTQRIFLEALHSVINKDTVNEQNNSI